MNLEFNGCYEGNGMEPVQYFDVPLYRDLKSIDGWEQLDDEAEKYHVVRGVFKIESSHMPGGVMIGAKYDPIGAPGNVAQKRKKVDVRDVEVLQEVETIKRHIVETGSMVKVLGEICTAFGDGNTINTSGKVSGEMSKSIKSHFLDECHISDSVRLTRRIVSEVDESIDKECTDLFCNVNVYQKSKAVLFLQKIDFLNLEYTRSGFGLRKKLKKYPFPSKLQNRISDHPNVIKIGVPIAELQFWDFLPKSSVVVKDADYVQEVENPTEVIVRKPGNSLRSGFDFESRGFPSLYQLSRVAFPFKWVNKKRDGFSRDELMALELGEAEESGWWYQHGPGRKKKK